MDPDGAHVPAGRPAAWPLVASIALIAAAVAPWTTFQGHPHWNNIRWIPFYTAPVGVTDVVANLLLFAPLGAALAGRNLTMGATALFSAALSIAGEWTQLYSHGRFPATHDVICNVSGALGAARLLTEWKLRMARSTGGTGS